MRIAKLASKVFAIWLLLAILIFGVLALSGLGYFAIYFPPFFWLGALLVPEGGPAVVGVSMWAAASLLSLLVTAYLWLRAKRPKKPAV